MIKTLPIYTKFTKMICCAIELKRKRNKLKITASMISCSIICIYSTYLYKLLSKILLFFCLSYCKIIFKLNYDIKGIGNGNSVQINVLGNK